MTNPDPAEAPAVDEPHDPVASIEPANEDSPSAAKTQELIALRPSRWTLYAALILTAFCVGSTGAYIWGLYGPDRITAIEPETALTIFVVLLLPVSLIWLFALVIWRAQHLELMSRALAETALKLALPEDMAADRVASVASAVRRESSAMRDGVDTVLERATTLQGEMAAQLEALERTTSRAELRSHSLRSALAKERRLLEDLAGALSADTASLLQRLDGQVDSYREQSGSIAGDLDAAALRLDQNTENLARQVSEATEKFDQGVEQLGEAATSAGDAVDRANTALDTRLERLASLNQTTEQTTKEFAESLDQHIERLAGATGAVEQAGETVRARLIEESHRLSDIAGQIAGQARDIEERTRSAGSALTAALEAADADSVNVRKAFEETVGEIARSAETIAERFESALSRSTDSARETATAVQQSAETIRDDIADAAERVSEVRTALTSTAVDVDKAVNSTSRSLTAAVDRLHGEIENLPERARVSATEIGTVLERQITALAALANIAGRSLTTHDFSEPDAESAERPASPEELPRAEGTATPSPRPSPGTGRQATRPPATGNRRWGISELLAAADESGPSATSPREMPAASATRDVVPGRSSLHIIEALHAISADLDRALEDMPSAELWHRYQAGERHVFTRRLYNRSGRVLHDAVARKYKEDAEFRQDVDRYIAQFERLLQEASANDRDGLLAETYLGAETGKVYLLLAQASGHIT